MSHATRGILKDPAEHNSLPSMDSKTPERDEKQEAHTTRIDISLINVSLSLSHEERVDAHESARALMEDLREAGKKYYANRPKGSA